MIYGQNPSKESRPVQTDADGRVLVSLQNSAGADNTVKVGAIANPSASFSVPNSAATYAIGDLIANSATAGSVTPLSFANVARVAAGAFSAVRARLHKTGTGITGAAFRAHAFASLPTVTNGDDGVFLPATGMLNYLGAWEFYNANMVAGGDGVACVGVPVGGFPIMEDLPAGTTIYVLLEARGAYVRTAGETFTLVIEVDQE